MELFSKHFKHRQKIPAAYTRDGKNISPALYWSDIPEGTSSFALSVIDPDAPGGNFIHWLVYNIPKKISSIPEGGPLPENSKELTNDFGRRTYGGPCPPSGIHRYFFTLYALKTKELKNITRNNFLKEVQKYSLTYTELIALYSKKKQ